MTIFSNSNMVFIACIIVICIPIFIIGFILYDKFEFKNEALSLVGAIASAISGLSGAIAIILGVILFAHSAAQHNMESTIYAEQVEVGCSLQQAINASTDIVNTDLYLRAVDFNAELASIQEAQRDSRYSMTFSGECDWTAIPFVEFN